MTPLGLRCPVPSSGGVSATLVPHGSHGRSGASQGLLGDGTGRDVPPRGALRLVPDSADTLAA